MNLFHLMRMAAFVAATALTALTASAANVTYSTNGAGTGFGGSSLSLNSVSGAPATLTFIADVNISTGVPSNVNFGNFTLVCGTCTTQAGGVGSTFGGFTFDLVITDVTDGATGTFVGTSTGGQVYSDVSQITINWAPLQLGPGTFHSNTGSFGPAIFTTTVFTGIVAPNSGAVPGQSTIQGHVDFAAAPEPSALGLVGAGLLGLGFWGRRRYAKA